MPKVVDHEERRREIAGAAWRAVGRRGIEAATVREIAEESGFSTGVLAHYFEGKDDLILFALHAAVERAAGRMERRGGGKRGLEALRAVLREALPLDEERRQEARVWIGFWGKAAGSADLREEQNRWYALWRGVLATLIQEAQREGELRGELDAEREAASLVAFIDGVCLQATFEPDRFDTGMQVDLLDAQLARLAEGG